MLNFPRLEKLNPLTSSISSIIIDTGGVGLLPPYLVFLTSSTSPIRLFIRFAPPSPSGFRSICDPAPLPDKERLRESYS